MMGNVQQSTRREPSVENTRVTLSNVVVLYKSMIILEHGLVYEDSSEKNRFMFRWGSDNEVLYFRYLN